jgi:hypothetical protein
VLAPAAVEAVAAGAAFCPGGGGGVLKKMGATNITTAISRKAIRSRTSMDISFGVLGPPLLSGWDITKIPSGLWHRIKTACMPGMTLQ